MKNIIDKKSNIDKIIIIVCFLIIIYIVYIFYNKITKEQITKEQFTKESFYDYFDCYLKLIDINPQFVKQYMKFNNRHVSVGYCTDATLHVTVEPCPTDSNGIPSSSCMETAILTSSKGNPLEFPYKINPENLTKYFGIKV